MNATSCNLTVLHQEAVAEDIMRLTVQWQWVSMKAGRTVRPFASSTSSPSGTSSPRPTAAIFPSRSQTSTALPALSFALRISMVGTSL